MSGLQRLAVLGVVVASGVTAFALGARPGAPVERTEPPFESLQPPIVRGEPFANSREAERSRRAKRASGDPKQEDGWNYTEVLKGQKHPDGSYPVTKPAEPMPPTSCRSIEPVPEHPDRFGGPHRVHFLTVTWFATESGFGFMRMVTYWNTRRIDVPARVIDRVELVSLLTDYEPSVYVLDETPTPALARQAKRRCLDEFERLGLDAVRRGENLVWTREAPKRMFGAIRAGTSCLECHTGAREGDLLGAFTYYLDTPVDQLRND